VTVPKTSAIAVVWLGAGDGTPRRKKIDIAKDKLASVDRDACSMFLTPTDLNLRLMTVFYSN
jgi:hypothetical protein